MVWTAKCLEQKYSEVHSNYTDTRQVTVNTNELPLVNGVLYAYSSSTIHLRQIIPENSVTFILFLTIDQWVDHSMLT